ncbi:hypothetical protein AX14_008518 [Amanita brunnescens Koide BX004]|nr:hypothetical protein AX14_008518 [Amanita brunnescens Koide BX004]
MVEYKYYIQTIDNNRYVQSIGVKDGKKVQVNAGAQILLLDQDIVQTSATTVTIKALGNNVPPLYINPPSGGDDVIWGTFTQKWNVVPEPGTNYFHIVETNDLTYPVAAGSGDEERLWTQKAGIEYISLKSKDWKSPTERRWHFIPAE